MHNYYTPKGFEIAEDDLVVDIGAHIGIFSIFAAQFAKNGQVYGFEPIRENFELFERNVGMNAARNILPINKAISNMKGVGEMFLSRDNTGGHSFHRCWSAKKSVNVQMTTLEDFIDDNRISHVDFLKMDCEGEEYRILNDCPDRVLGMIRKISMESHNIDDDRNVSHLESVLVAKGFTVRIRSDGCSMLYAKR